MNIIGAESVRNSEGFQNLRNISFPGAFAAVDCTHIRISGNIKDNSYLNRNRYHSVNLQAVCDFEGNFINLEIIYNMNVYNIII